MQTADLLISALPLADSLAHLAYLDPGTGSYALQLLLAGLFGGMFALKQSWRQCRAWLAQTMLDRRKASASLEATD